MENRGFELQEKNVKLELENLENKYDLMKKDVCLMERMEGLDGLRRLNFEENLVRIQRNCDGFGEMLVRLREDYNLFRKREDRNQERHLKLTEEHLKMVEEKNSEISELKNNLNEMKGRCEAFEQRMKERDMIIEACEKKIECRDGIIEKMRLQELQSCRTIKVLRHSNLKAVQAVEDLRCQKLEDDKAVAARESALDSRVKKMEEEFSSLLNVKIDDLRNVMNKSIPLLKDGGVPSPSEKQICGSCSTHSTNDAGVPNVAATPTSRQVEPIDVTCEDFPKRGSRDVIQTKSNEGGTRNPVECSPQAGEESRCHPSQSISRVAHPVRGSNRLRGSDINTIVEIIAVDDALNLGGDLCSNDSSFSLSAKRKRSSKKVDAINTSVEIIDVDGAPNLGGDSLSKKFSMILSSKRKKSSEEVLGYHNPISHMRKQIEDSSGPEDSHDESSFDSLASIKNQCLQGTWMSATDMRKAFQEDDNLCMNAVCVLFRQLIFPSDELIPPSDHARELLHFQAMRGPEVALYLNDGCPYVKPKKSALEVKQEGADVIDICRRLALDYSERLFSIYCLKKDPFFKSSKAS